MSSWRKHCMLMCMRRQNKDDDATSLDYRHSSLNDVPSDVFTHERTLEELRLDSNHIRDLPRVCSAWFKSNYQGLKDRNYFTRCSQFLVSYLMSFLQSHFIILFVCWYLYALGAVLLPEFALLVHIGQ